jgi:hypothetical protein
LNHIGTGALRERIGLVKPGLTAETSLSKLSRAPVASGHAAALMAELNR